MTCCALMKIRTRYLGMSPREEIADPRMTTKNPAVGAVNSPTNREQHTQIIANCSSP